MRLEASLTRIERELAIPDASAAHCVRVHATPPEGRVDRDGTDYHPSEVDDLRAARGIFTALLLSLGLWAMIGLVVWLIAR